MIATSKAAYEKTDSKFIRERNNYFSKEEIERIVARGNPVERAALSEFFFVTNGLYKRIILHYATFLTYSWILVPYLKDMTKKASYKDKKIGARYYDAADFCTTFQIDRKCAVFAKEIFVKGGYYGLIHDTGNKLVIQDLPFDYCRSRFKNAEDIDIVEFNVAFFDSIRDEKLKSQMLSTYPKVVQKAYRDYKYRNKDKWFFLPAEMGIYFNFFEERPFFLDLIPLLDELDDYKAIDKKRNIQALKKIIVQEIPHDGLKLVFEPEEAEVMHDGSVDMMSNNDEVDVLTTYAKVSMLDMSDDTDDRTEIEDIQNLIYSSAGLSKELFFATTAAGLEYCINNDLAMVMMLGQKFAHFFTTLLNYKFEDKKIKFKLLILPISYYNCKDYTSRAKDLAAFGYSFLTPILSTGIDQTNLAALKELENELLNLDEVLKPLQSAYTQSGKTPSSATNAITAEASKQTQSAAKEQTKTEPAKTESSDSNSDKKEAKKETKKKETKQESDK